MCWPFCIGAPKGPFLQGLKVPKREIFNRSDFPDFYAIKSLRVGDCVVKIKFKKKYLGAHLGVQVPYAYAQSIFKEVFF